MLFSIVTISIYIPTNSVLEFPFLHILANKCYLNSSFFFPLMLICKHCLYMLDINLILVISLANSFLHLVGCFFILFMVSFAVQKLLSLIGSHLFIFAFISFTLEDRLKKYCCDLCQRVFCLFSSRNFIVSGLTFSSLIHFKIYFYIKC